MIFNSGSKDAKIVIVGEAPGLDEAREGIPFVGNVGKVINNALARVGIPRASCYLTYVVKAKLEKNDITPFIEFGRGGVSQSAEYYEFETRLADELKECKANVIVAVGKVALYALTRRSDIMNVRGSVLEATEEFGKRKVIPIVHPAVAIKQWLFTYMIYWDMAKVAVECNFPEIRRVERNIRIIKTKDEAVEWIRACNKCKMVGFDIESIRHELSCFALAKDINNAASIVLYHNGQYLMTPEEIAEVLNELALLLKNPDVVKVLQNATYDMYELWSKFGIETINFKDTMVATKILMCEMPAKLAFICSLYTDLPYYKDEGKVWKDGIATDTFYNYNAKDALVCIEAINKLEKHIIALGDPTYKIYLQQTYLIKSLMRMSFRGMRVNHEKFKEAKVSAEEKLLQLEAQFYDMCNGAVNYRSPKQLLLYFMNARGIRPYINRKTGNPTIDVKALTRLRQKGIAEAGVLLEIRKVDKLLNTYFGIRMSLDGRLRGSFNPVGTKQGRVSSSKFLNNTGANTQNLPREIRQYITADENYLMFCVDLSQAENRIVAYVSGDVRMIHAFENNLDVHCITAGSIFNKAPEEVSSADGSAGLGGGRLSERDWGKRANHAFNYDFSANSFAELYGISKTESMKIYNAYHATYPSIKHVYHMMIKTAASKDRRLVNLKGRVRKFLGRFGDSLFKEMYSYIPQSTVADIINEAINSTTRHDEFQFVELLNHEHDAIRFQISKDVPMELIIKYLNFLSGILTTPLRFNNRVFSIPAEFKVGYCAREQNSSNSIQGGMIKLKELTISGLTNLIKQLDSNEPPTEIIQPDDIEELDQDLDLDPTELEEQEDSFGW